jgi:predicted RNA binding protein YcfA (HicA-like mRNA interferase family)
VKAVSGKDMGRALELNGWYRGHVKGNHHYFKPRRGGATVCVPDHANKTLKPGTQRGIMKAAGLTDDDL